MQLHWLPSATVHKLMTGAGPDLSVGLNICGELKAEGQAWCAVQC